MTTPESLLEQIALDQQTIANLEARIKANKTLLDTCLEDGTLQHLIDDSGSGFTYTTIRLTRSKRTTWKYPSAVTKQIKALQELAQLNGDAESSTVHFWVVKCQ